MRSEREFSETLLQTWEGYKDEDLVLELLLKKAMGIHISEGSEAEYLRKRKWGCTCGQCDEGWMSKRMRLRLKCQPISSHVGQILTIFFWVGRRSSSPSR